MTFREDYQNDFNDVCVGPSWTKFGPGEFSIKLDKKSNFLDLADIFAVFTKFIIKTLQS